MLTYFLTQLDVRARLIAPRLVGDRQKELLLDQVCAALSIFFDQHASNHIDSTGDAWNQAYYLERLLALLEPADMLIDDVERRLDEAADEKVAAASRLRTAYEAVAPQIIDNTQSPPVLKPSGEHRLRAMLLDILEEMHWTFRRKSYSRCVLKSTARRLIAVGLGACGCFLLPYVYIYIRKLCNNAYELPFSHWEWLPLWTVITAGFFGAMFSRLLFLQASWNAISLGAIKYAQDFASIFLRGAVGTTGAVVVYHFLLSGMIQGKMFPEFQHIALRQLTFGDTKDAVPLSLIVPNADLALLVVWSFLAGFSERLVPTILRTTEASLDESAVPRKKT